MGIYLQQDVHQLDQLLHEMTTQETHYHTKYINSFCKPPVHQKNAFKHLQLEESKAG